MKNIFFTSDWHLSHSNILRHCNRPFSNKIEMDQAIMNNFWACIKPNDIVYYVGDLSYSKNMAERFLKEIFEKNIEFHFIRGNHDRKLQDTFLQKYCASISLYKDICIDKQKITVCHYPMYSWNCSHYEAWLIHGHHHRETSSKFQGKIMNIGVDVNYFLPVSYDHVKDYMKTREDNWDKV